MSCAQVPRVHALADGELSAAEATDTQAHLADCAECQAELAEVLQLELTFAEAARQSAAKVTPLRRRVPTPRARLAPIGAAAAAVAALVAIYWVARPRTISPAAVPGQDVGAVALALPAQRSWEARLSWRGAADHRPYHVARSAEPTSSSIPLGALAALEHRGDVHGVGVLAMLNGDYRQADAFLARAATSAEVIADRAALALAEGDADRALDLTDRALRTTPGHAAATWNRALALRDLGLPHAAAAAFAAVAARGEAGWSAEAKERAAALSAEAAQRRQLTERVLAAGPGLAAGPSALTVEDARSLPGLTRLFVYDALRAATPAQLAALQPWIAAVDSSAGEVAASAKRVAAVTAAHPQLAATYAQILAGKPPSGDARQRYLAALRSAHADDLLIGALLRLSPSGRVVAAAELPEFAKLTAASPDPWMKLLGAEQRAQVALAAGDLPAAEAALLRVRLRCQAGGAEAPAFRCIKLGLLLGDIYGRWQRVSEARAELLRALSLARAEREWVAENQVLEALANVAVVADDATGSKLPSARAYLEELELRQPERCDLAVTSRHLIAQVLLNQLRVEDARRELEAAPTCDAAMPAADQANQIFVRAQLLRESGTAADISALRARIAALRGDASTPPQQRAVLDHAEGRLLIDGGPGRDAPAGEALLRTAIASAAALASADATARKVVAFSYSVLTLALAKRGDGAGALTALAQEQGVDVPTSCALGLAVEDQRRMAVARDARGGWVVRYDEHRTTTSDDPKALVSAEILAALASCPSVDVLARPPLHGTSRLLPESIAWRYRSARHSPLRLSEGPAVVVADVEPPAALALPRLATWQTPRSETLSGAAATPARVLAAIANAGEVVIHAHGVGAPGASDASFLALSSDAAGRYALTVADVRAATLHHSPLVVLAACRASLGAPVLHEPWSLPAAFVYAGARAVVASAAPIPDSEAGEFFDGVRAAVTAGATVAVAVRDARVRWLGAHRGEWVKDILVFE
jgi:cellulose synthase operon protein C